MSAAHAWRRAGPWVALDHGLCRGHDLRRTIEDVRRIIAEKETG